MPHPNPSQPVRPPSSPRLEGLDLTRALALLGMVVVNYELALGAWGQGPAWLAGITGSIQGRAAATFIVLAGVGASLGAARARRSGDPLEQRAARLRLARRGLFLLVAGTAFMPIWEADILHFYGVWLGLGALLVFAPRSVLAGVCLALTLGGALFYLQGDYFAHWNLIDLTYRDLATPSGYLRNLFLDGWHPFFPWAALYVFGIGLGRIEFADARVRRRVLLAGAVVLAAVLWTEHSFAPRSLWATGPRVLLSTAPLPPTPAFVVGGAALASVAIALACELVVSLPGVARRPLVATGQLALTLYIAHVIVGLGVLEALGRLEGQTLPFAVGSALTFCAASALFAVLWHRRFARGPVEALMRRISG